MTESAERAEIRPIAGPTVFIVPTSITANWKTELRKHVDLVSLGVKLIVAHNKTSDPNFEFTYEMRKAIKTTRSSDHDPKKSKKRKGIGSARDAHA